MAANTGKCLVLGCGVMGLTTANLLLDAGLEVGIVAEHIPPHTTSNQAGALWFPYHAAPRNRVCQWARISYQRFQILAGQSVGVSMVPLRLLYPERSDHGWWKKALPKNCSVCHLAKKEIPPPYQQGYLLEVPMIEPGKYLNGLLASFFCKGGYLRQAALPSLEEVELDRWDFIVNTTGLGAKKLFQDADVYPLGGHMIQLEDKLDYAVLDESSSKAPAYIFPRPSGAILGGTAEIECEGQVHLRRVGEILTKTIPLAPELRHSKIQNMYVAFRPARKEIRLEREYRNGIWFIHNYGHGGCGFTLSWGCGEEVLRLAAEILKKQK